MGDVTNILSAIEGGDEDAASQLLPLVYAELRRIAAQRMAGEAAGHTLQSTALVHEAYLRLVGDGVMPKWDTRGHFFAAAAEAMRRILIDRARAKRTRKRGGDFTKLRLDGVGVSLEDPPAELLDLDDAIEELAKEEPRQAALVHLRFFAGLSCGDAAAILGIAPRTARDDWSFARAWLFRHLSKETSA